MSGVFVRLLIVFFIASPSFAQSVPETPQEAPASRELKVVTNGTLDHIAKFDGSGGNNVVDSAILESGGNVAIGTTNVSSRLNIFSNTVHHLTLRSNNASVWNLTNHNSGYFGITKDNSSIPALTILNSGNIGIGTSSPAAPLHVIGSGWFNLTTPLLTGASVVARDSVEAQRFGGGTNAAGVFCTSARGTESVPQANALNDETGRLVIRGYDGATTISSARIGAIVDDAVSSGVLPQAITFKTGTSNSPSEQMRITSAGNVGIGTSGPTAKLHVVGDVIATGTITGAKVIGAVYQDLAEWVPATTNLEPGTVVILNRTKGNEVMASNRPYDTAVAGVVSANPGIILGESGDGKEQIATTGRVRVRVDASKSAIEVGDLLVTSDVPGTAMKSIPVELSGIAMHRPGTIIGKALEPLAQGMSEILVLLSLQ